MEIPAANSAWLMAVLAVCSYATCYAATLLSGPDSLFGASVRLLTTRELFAAEVFYAVFVTVTIISIGIFRDRKTVKDETNKANRRIRRANRESDCYRRHVDKLSVEIERLRARHVDDLVEIGQLRERFLLDHEGRKRLSAYLLPIPKQEPDAPKWLSTYNSTINKLGSVVKTVKGMTAKYQPQVKESGLRSRAILNQISRERNLRTLRGTQPWSTTGTNGAQVRALKAEIDTLKTERNKLAAQHDKTMALLKTTTDGFDKIKQDLDDNLRSKELLINRQASDLCQLQQKVDSAEKLTAEARDALCDAVQGAVNSARSEERQLASQSSALLVDNAVQLALAGEQQKAIDKAEKVQQESDRVFKEEQTIRTLADAQFDKFQKETLDKERSQQLLINQQAETILQLQQRIDNAEGLTNVQEAINQAVNLARAEELSKASQASQNSALLIDNAVQLARADEQEQARNRAILVQQEFEYQLATNIFQMQQRLDGAEQLARDVQNAMDDAVKNAVDAARAHEQQCASQRLAFDIEAAVKQARNQEQAEATQKYVMLQHDFDLKLSIKDKAIKALEAARSNEKVKLDAAKQESSSCQRLLGEKDEDLAKMHQKITYLTEEVDRLAQARGWAEDEGRSFKEELDACEVELADAHAERDDYSEEIEKWKVAFEDQQNSANSCMVENLQLEFKISEKDSNIEELTKGRDEWEKKARQHQEASRRFLEMVQNTRDAAQVDKTQSDAEIGRLRAELAAATTGQVSTTSAPTGSL